MIQKEKSWWRIVLILLGLYPLRARNMHIILSLNPEDHTAQLDVLDPIDRETIIRMLDDTLQRIKNDNNFDPLNVWQK